MRRVGRQKNLAGSFAGIAIAWRGAHGFPSASRVAELYSYDPDTGILLFRSEGKLCGQPAGWTMRRRTGSYRIAQVDQKQVPVQRIAWAIMTGSWPAPGFVIDHKNGDGLDNRWDNLRLATRQENNRNRLRPAPSSGFRNVRFDKRSGKWHAYIYADGFQRLGAFLTAEDASSAYEAASIRYFGEFSPILSRGNTTSL